MLEMVLILVLMEDTLRALIHIMVPNNNSES